VASTNVSARRRPPPPRGFHSLRLDPVGGAKHRHGWSRCCAASSSRHSEPAGQRDGHRSQRGTSSRPAIGDGREAAIPYVSPPFVPKPDPR
jgi:hypothetical protein